MSRWTVIGIVAAYVALIGGIILTLAYSAAPY